MTPSLLRPCTSGILWWGEKVRPNRKRQIAHTRHQPPSALFVVVVAHREVAQQHFWLESQSDGNLCTFGQVNWQAENWWFQVNIKPDIPHLKASRAWKRRETLGVWISNVFIFHKHQGDHQFLELKIPAFTIFKMSTRWWELIPHLDRAAQPEAESAAPLVPAWPLLTCWRKSFRMVPYLHVLFISWRNLMLPTLFNSKLKLTFSMQFCRYIRRQC